jgi:23S rRNA (cytidine1920-2'-O)/16S rRNA (cytidine1409-2'-O)-methyltransferase
VRSLRPEQVAPAPQLVVSDLSFISLRLVLPALAVCSAPDADHVLMVKPQFEVGRADLGSGGVVRDSGLRVSAVAAVAEAARAEGLALRGVAASPLPGPSGNVEYFVWLRRDAGGDPGPDRAEIRHQVERAVAEGPQDGLAAAKVP